VARLTDESLAWLRALVLPDGGNDDAVIGTALALGRHAATTPAWTERYAALLEGLAARTGSDRAASAVAGQRAEVATLAAHVPQVVDLDASIVLTRAEWVDESLFLWFEPADEDATRRTSFRIVGAEPRMWYVTGIQDVTMDVTGAAVIMRVARVRGDLVLTPGSY